MTLLRLASLIVLALWVGGLATLGFLAAPTIFDVLELHELSGLNGAEAGRAMAGEVFGAVFQRFQHAAWAMGGLLLALYGLRAALGPRPRRLALRMWTTIAMLAMSLVTALVIAPRIDAIRQSTKGAVAALPDGDPARASSGASTASRTV
jgi:hypothetical protein